MFLISIKTQRHAHIIYFSCFTHSLMKRLSEPGLFNVINANKNTTEPFSQLADETFPHFRSDVTPRWVPFLQQQNDDINDDINSELLERDNNQVEQLNNSNTEDFVSGNTSIPGVDTGILKREG